ncbi:bifunctional GTP diphosphokinase/guanosine-3',5'-bis pyrophosphate 3'-pyrophosphohydrolase [Candidatus Pseudomonas adelgestsugas]|uniref:guanosine-3',5'-bis(diphosphate) 3'-diphosphatase n=1 Tax=Candidatus Pseudomonas adelgestsugas TaxID=1302376 RepID=A0ABX5R6Y2_9PSED|nr:bifunctional GTP diphosphokinase/guanosine-3',5'-bis pyrophosphate 3'-pyrophosphohydrolase [Candidatus Pseudomonas adelgestsugas]QAX81401.1 Bifunctional (p)ppGpp synthase/hydrolase SpoT [Candidatus Pseudomonas adelgestsugas]
MPSIDAFTDRLSTYLGQDQINMVRKAYFYAAQAHDGQRRRSGEAYVTHPLAVANILADMHMDHQSLMAAMLHDVIEDTGIAKETLNVQFGETVAELVDGVSKLTQMHFETKAEAQAENFQKMAMAMARDIRVILVKLADRLHNMRTLGVLSSEKRRRIAKETLEIYAPIANRLGMHAIRTEFEDLGFKAIHPMRSACIYQAVKRARGNRNEIVNKIEKSLSHCLEIDEIKGEISGRQKHIYSIYKKMRGKRWGFNEIMDVYAFRIIVDKVDTCYRVLGAVHNLYKPLPGRFKDYIAIPKANGYQSLHTALFGIHGVPIEIQIRTHEMEEMANNGIAAYWLYKASGDKQPKGTYARAHQWVKSVLEMQQRAGNSLEFIESVKIDLFPDEVYVFTPKGRIMELPKGSTAVDFAYAVHTDVGNSCIACRINRRLAPLSEPLQSGYTVEIVSAPGARPNPAWLNFLVTGKARMHIRHALKLRRRSESISLGERLLSKALNGFNSAIDSIPAERIQAMLHEYQQETIEDLLEDIGIGNRMAYLVANRLLSDDDQLLRSEDPLAICGTEGLILNYAKCCTPIPGDPIIGYLSAGKGMVVHLDNCRNISEIRQNQEQYIQLSWDQDVVGEFNVELRVEMEHRRGLITLLASSVNTADGNIEKISMNKLEGRISIIQVVVNVHDRVHLARVIKKLRALTGIMRITRMRA